MAFKKATYLFVFMAQYLQYIGFHIKFNKINIKIVGEQTIPFQ